MGVWLYPEGFANILLLINAEKKYCLTYDSAPNDRFEVYKSDITVWLYALKERAILLEC